MLLHLTEMTKTLRRRTHAVIYGTFVLIYLEIYLQEPPAQGGEIEEIVKSHGLCKAQDVEWKYCKCVSVLSYKILFYFMSLRTQQKHVNLREKAREFCSRKRMF